VARRRLGVACLLDPPVADEIDGLRRALADRSLGRIAPHLTLVPPFNLPAGDLPLALTRLRDAAAALPAAVTLTLGPPESFLPHSAVLYLAVGGEVELLVRLHSLLRAAPFDRPRTWPFVPHVTLADAAPGAEARLEWATEALAGYQAEVVLTRLVLLELVQVPTRSRGAGAPRRWVPLADAALGPPATVGRGGLETRVFAGRLVDPRLTGLLGGGLLPPTEPTATCAAGPVPAGTGRRATTPWPAPIVLSAERGGEPVGAARAWWSAGRPWVQVGVVAPHRRTGVGTVLLGQLEAAVRAAGWAAPVAYGLGPAGFYAARSAWVQPAP